MATGRAAGVLMVAAVLATACSGSATPQRAAPADDGGVEESPIVGLVDSADQLRTCVEHHGAITAQVRSSEYVFGELGAIRATFAEGAYDAVITPNLLAADALEEEIELRQMEHGWPAADVASGVEVMKNIVVFPVDAPGQGDARVTFMHCTGTY
jgi:hypothetical protein